jgi:hypothetical protein
MKISTRKEFIAAAGGVGAAAVLARFPELAEAAEFRSLGSPPELDFTYPEPRVFMETQCWWVEGQTGLLVPGSDFPFTSIHDHLGMNFPMGERVVFPAAGQGYDWKYLAQFHNDVGATVRGVRGGGFQMGCEGIVYDPASRGVKVTQQDQRLVGNLHMTPCTVDLWRSKTGTFENRFTSDTTSKFGQRMYQSGAWNAQFNIAGAPVGFTGRGWYQGADYTNITLATKTRASILAAGGLPNSLSYSIANGAKFAFAYIDPNIHAGSKGTVLFENRTAVGAFTLPPLAPGLHILLLGAWEKIGTGWNAGVLRLPFMRI